MAARPAPVVMADPVETLLRELIDVNREILAALQQQRQRPVVPLSRADRVVLSRMLPAIAGTYGSETFSARDLAEDDRPAVRLVVQGRSVKQLAQLFSKADGIPIDALKLEWHGLEDRVTVWRIVAV